MNGVNDIDGIRTASLKEVSQDAALVDEVIDWYIAVFNATGPGEWNEQWTPDQVRKKLFEDSAHEAERSFIGMWRKDGVLAGADIICVMPVADAVTSRDLPPTLQDAETLAAVRCHLEWVAGPTATVAMFRELGIRKEHRKGLEPIFGMTQSVMRAGLDAGANFGCFWTSKDSNLFALMVGYGVEVLYDFADPKGHVFMGDHLDHSFRRFSAPANVAARMIAERCALRGIRTARGK